MTQMMEQMTIPGLEEMAQGSPGRGRWEMVKLSHLFEKPISGEWGDEATEEDSTAVGVIRTTNFSKDYRIKTSSEIVLRKIDLLKVEKKKLLFGDVIIEKSGGSPNQPVGRIVFYDLERGNTLCNNFTSILRPKQNTFPKYACYALFYLHQNGSTLKFQNKTTGIINLKLERYLEDIKIPLPPLPEQQRIVARLDKAQQLIDQRKEQLKLMDALVQSLFYEMFGDPVKNEKGFRVVSLAEISKKVTDGTHLTPQFIDSGIPFIFVKNIRNGRIDFKTDKYISEEQFRELTKRSPIESGDILYTTVGATYGFAAIVGQFTEFCFQRHVAHIKPNKDIVLPKFLELVMQLPTIKAQADRKVRGAAQPTLNLKELREFTLLLPPLPLQQTFADRVQQIEDLKQSMTASLRELEHNFNALMQQAFGG